MKWNPDMQLKAEVMAACKTSLAEIGRILSVSPTTVALRLVPQVAQKRRQYQEANRDRFREHLRAYNAANPEKTIWRSMVSRCTNPSSKHFRHYGGRGIVVCQQWIDSCDAFIADVGRRPSPDHSIDRIDNNGNYEPGNVRWATRSQQGRNKRNNVWVELDGEIMILPEAAERLGEPIKVAHSRLGHGIHPRLRRVNKSEAVA